MKNKQTYLMRASFAILIFVMLGYSIKFYPEVIEPFDTTIQNLVRGKLPDRETQFFATLTILGNPSVQIATVILTSLIFYLKKWYMEAAVFLLNGSLAGLATLSLKAIYQRPRPSLEHLVHADNFSFPSGHSLGSILILGTLMVIINQRLKHKQLKMTLLTTLATSIFLIGLSRIYLGVHYPTDVIAGFTLGYGMLNAIYPYYDQKRFEWRFQNKQA